MIYNNTMAASLNHATDGVAIKMAADTKMSVTDRAVISGWTTKINASTNTTEQEDLAFLRIFQEWFMRNMRATS